MLNSGSCQLAFDPHRGKVIAQSYPLHEWSGTDWVALPTSAQYFAMTHGILTDHTRQRVLGFDRRGPGPVMILTDTAAAAEGFGAGCALGVMPALHAMMHPTPGNALFAIDLGSLAPSAPTFLVLGLGSQSQPLGAGCTLLVAQPLATLFAMAPPSGQVRHAIPIPNDPGLRGVLIVAQGAVLDPARSLLGTVTLTAGLRVIIGD